MIPYGRQNINAEDIQAVADVLNSPFLTQGPAVPSFEDAICKVTGASHALAVNSATSALHMACLALGVGKGDVVWTTPNSFVASSNCALYCGAQVDFVDIDPRTYNMCAEELERKLQLAPRLPKVVIPVSFAGQSPAMARIKELSLEYGFKIIEDASHAIGGSYRGKPIGCGEYADITIFSFHPVKIITTAEGGVAATNDPVLAEKMSLLRSHGITRDALKMTSESEGGWYYQQVDLGYNYRMTEMQAALGLSQIQRLEAFVARRHELARRYEILLQDLPVVIPYQDPAGYSALHLYPIVLRDASRRGHVFNNLREKGIGVNVHYIPIHLQPYYKALGFTKGDFPRAEAYYAGTISLPLYYDLTEAEQNKVVEILTESIRGDSA